MAIIRQRPAKLWFWATTVIGLALVTCTVGGLLVPPAMYSDSGWGFAVWRSMQRGAPFNRLEQADANDIRQDSRQFMATWTPGQFLIPGILSASGLSLGQSLTLTAFLFSCAGVIGWYLLYRRLGISEEVALWSCTVIALSRYFVLPFSIYNGGELLLFGGGPYIVITSLWAAEGKWFRSLVLIPIFLCGFFLKNSALILELALCGALTIHSWRSGDRWEQVIGWVRWPLAFALTYLIAYVTYTSRGWTAVSYQARLVDLAVGKGFFALAGPFFSALSADEALSWILSRPGNPLFPNWQFSLPFIVPLAALAGYFYWRTVRTAGSECYRVFVVGFLATYILVFVALNVTGSAVSSTTEARHFRSAGLILLPGLVAAAFEARRRWVRLGCRVVFLVVCLYGVLSFANKFHGLRGIDGVGRRGFTQTSLDQPTTAWIRETDDALSAGTALFYLTSPELSLEVEHGRVILSHADFEPRELLASRTYRGRVAHLYVVLPQRVILSGKADLILASFVDYDKWQAIPVGESTVYVGLPNPEIAHPLSSK